MNTSVKPLLTKHRLGEIKLVDFGRFSNFLCLGKGDRKVVQKANETPGYEQHPGASFFKIHPLEEILGLWSKGQLTSGIIENSHKCMLIILILSAACDVSIWLIMDQSWENM